MAEDGCTMPSLIEITVPRLARLNGTPDAPTLVDPRTDEDFAADQQRIPGACRPAFKAPDTLAPKLARHRAAVYCQRGRKISQDAVAILREAGIACEAPESGEFGWRDAGRPMLKASAMPPVDAQGRTT